MENLNGLGNLISEHEENKTATGTNLILGLVCLGLGVAMAVFFTKEKTISFNSVLFGLSAVCSFGAGVSCLWSFIKNRRARVTIYENGLTVEKSKKQTALWSEIAVVTEKVEQMYLNGKYVYDRYSYAVEKQDGETFELSNLISNVDRIGRTIKEKTFEHLYPPMVAKINNGEQVLFGSLAVDKNSLGGIAWNDLSNASLKEGIIEVKDRHDKTVVNGSYGATPNAHLLIALLKERLPFE